jgi:hypothetical protein
MIRLVLLECGIEVGGIDRRHLMCRAALPDPRQVDERSDPTPREPRKALDRFLVMVDAIAPGRQRRIDVRQFETRGEGDDSLCGSSSHDWAPKKVLR